jgi:hypothetical protein
LPQLSDVDLLAILERKLEYAEENQRIELYQPIGALDPFIQAFGSGENFISIVSAANGIGKTALIANLIGNLAWGPQNKFFDFPIFKNWPYKKRIRYVSTAKNIEKIGPLFQEISTWWPKGKWEGIKAGHNYYSQYEANGWVMDVMTYDQDVKQFEGATLGLTICDEPPPRHLWSAMVGRHRKGGRMVTVMTPLTDAAWFFDEIVPNYPTFYADIEDACVQHGVRGHLEHNHIEDMIKNWPQDEVEARAHGKAMYLKGLIFKTFYPNVHVLKENIKVPYGAPVWNVVDPHSDKPFASIWAFPDARGDLYIHDEWPNEDFYRMHNCQLNIQDYKKIFGDKEAGTTIYRRIIDRHFADTPSAINKRTLRQELQAIGLNYLPSYKAEEEIDTGIEKVRRYLAYDTSKPLDTLNQPKIYVNPKCVNTIKSFQRWSRDAETGKVKDDYKDFMDVVRYLCVDNPRIPEPLPAQEFKKRW